MVTRVEGPGAQGTSFILRPNHSMHWKTAKAVFGVVCGYSGATATFFVLLGAWPILPFFGLEIVAVGTALYLSARSTTHREVVTIAAGEIVVERGHRRKTEEQRLPWHWSRVLLLRDTTGWYPSRLVVRAHGREMEIGRRLYETERVALARTLMHLRAAPPALPY